MDIKLFDRLPNHLHLVRNSNAPEYDRYRLYNIATEEYTKDFSGKDPEEVMTKYIEWEDQERKNWK